MQKFFFFNPKKVKLIKVNNIKSHILILYKILKERDRRSNISHKKIPTLEDHKIFINAFPYSNVLITVVNHHPCNFIESFLRFSSMSNSFSPGT